jgi:hypothetical protein
VARGWESKSVEAQQEEASRPRAAGDEAGQEPPEIQMRRRTLELARARARADLEKARVPAHREMLQQALSALDEQIAKL